MSRYAIEEFMVALSGDNGLEYELRSAVAGKERTGEIIAAVGRRHGYRFTCGELKEVMEETERENDCPPRGTEGPARGPLAVSAGAGLFPPDGFEEVFNPARL